LLLEIPDALPQIAMESIFCEKWIFFSTKKSDPRSSFFVLEKTISLKNLGMNSWIRLRKNSLYKLKKQSTLARFQKKPEN
jgi:hypothetical protein